MDIEEKGNKRKRANALNPLEYEDRDGEFANLMAQLGPGWSVAIDRILPRWCDGHLETLPANPAEPISIEMIRELFGGRVLGVTVRDQDGLYRGHRQLKFPDAPKDGDGRPLQAPPEPGQTSAAQNNSEFFSTQIGALSEMFKTVLKAQQEQSGQIVGLLEKRLDAVERKAEAAASAPIEAYEPPEPQNPLDNIKQLAATMRELEGLRTEMAARNPESAPGNEVSMIDGMVKEFFNLQIEKEKAKIQAAQMKVRPPAPDLPPRAAPAPISNGSTGARKRVSAANLSNEELAIAVHQRMQTMKPDEINRVMSIFMGQYQTQPADGQEEEDLDGGEEDDFDDLEDDNLDEDQPESVESTPRGTSVKTDIKNRAEPSAKPQG